MTTELQDLEITAVALVDNPANPMATIELFKRAEEPNPEGGHTVAADTVAKSDHDAVVAELEAARAELTALTEMSNDDLAELRGIDVAPAPEVDDDVLKSLPEDVRKRLETAEATIAKMEADARTETFAKKAAEFSHVAPVDELAPVLDALDKTDPELAKSLDRVLTAANARIAESGLFGEIGSDGERPTDGQADTLIAAEVAKGLSKVDAIRKVFSEHPELYPAARVGADG